MINLANSIHLTLPKNVDISYKKNLFYTNVKNDGSAIQHVRKAIKQWYYTWWYYT